MDTRAALLSAATRLFSTHGYDAVGVQDIVEAVGVTKPSLYHHFGSKHGLIEALIEERHAALMARLRPAAGYAHDLTGTLLALLSAYLDAAADDPAFFRLWMTLLVAPPEHECFALASLRYRDQLELIEQVFDEATADHGNMRGRARRYAYTFIALVNAIAALQLSGALVADEATRFAIIHQFSHGIYS